MTAKFDGIHDMHVQLCSYSVSFIKEKMSYVILSLRLCSKKVMSTYKKFPSLSFASLVLECELIRSRSDERRIDETRVLFAKQL